MKTAFLSLFLLATLVSCGSETAQAMGSEAKEGCCGGCAAEAPVAAATEKEACCEGEAKAEKSCCSEAKEGCGACAPAPEAVKPAEPAKQ
ncbi:MAG: hypothetical protein RL148_2436 [Planctomycetota bacterium]|jgi:hypothetical protein